MKKMREIIQDGYDNPGRKNCFYTGQNAPAVAEALVVKVWDWTPKKTLNVEPWYWNTHTLALAFGCKPVFTSEGKEWIEDLITNPKQAEDIEIPEVRAGRTGEILEKMEKMLKEYPEDVLIRLPDIQSPLGVAELMWDQSFYLALLTNPEEIHLLLEKISIFIINYVNEIKKVLGKRYNPATHPQVWSEGDGYYMSDDVNSMVSPEDHMQYSISYINKITEALGPLYYHSCTWTDLYLDNIEKLKGVRAVNWSFGTSNDPADLLKRFSGKYMICPHIGLGVHTEEAIRNLNKNINSELDLVKYMLDHMQENTSLYFCFLDDFCQDIDKITAVYELFDSYGHTPQAQGITN